MTFLGLIVCVSPMKYTYFAFEAYCITLSSA